MFTTHLQRQKNIVFSFIWLTWVQIFYLTSPSEKIFLNLQKHSSYLEKCNLKQKPIVQEGVITSYLDESTEGSFFKVICIFCLHRTLEKIHTWKLFACGKIFARGKIKSRRKSLVKIGKKIQALRTKKENHSVKKRKRSLVKATVTGGASRWRPDFVHRVRKN